MSNSNDPPFESPKEYLKELRESEKRRVSLFWTCGPQSQYWDRLMVYLCPLCLGGVELKGFYLDPRDYSIYHRHSVSSDCHWHEVLEYIGTMNLSDFSSFTDFFSPPGLF